MNKTPSKAVIIFEKENWTDFSAQSFDIPKEMGELFLGGSRLVELLRQPALLAGGGVGVNDARASGLVERAGSRFDIRLGGFDFALAHGTLRLVNDGLGKTAQGFIAFLPGFCHADFFCCGFGIGQDSSSLSLTSHYTTKPGD